MEHAGLTGQGQADGHLVVQHPPGGLAGREGGLAARGPSGSSHPPPTGSASAGTARCAAGAVWWHRPHFASPEALARSSPDPLRACPFQAELSGPAFDVLGSSGLGWLPCANHSTVRPRLTQSLSPSLTNQQCPVNHTCFRNTAANCVV